MFIVEILIVLLLLFLVALAIMLAASLTLSMPLADVINIVLRKIGLAGAYRGSRSIGGRGVGVVDETFTVVPDGTRAEGKLVVKGELWNARCDPSVAARLTRGDEVELVYDEDLTVRVIGKIGEDPSIRDS
jgi:membrane protein implicated in regulation of membrane protease activity